jgi:hypothetical protein
MPTACVLCISVQPAKRWSGFQTIKLRSNACHAAAATDRFEMQAKEIKYIMIYFNVVKYIILLFPISEIK